ncbi:AAA family ATPase [Streptomyces sp. NPDC005776]|uniref:AAA family ATPase n=1 Tax=unclassified Streptomyces TaxID=2593676 RepID=UPI0033E5BA86
MTTTDAEENAILRRHFVAIATSEYSDPAFKALRVEGEVQAIRAWLCSPALGAERVFTPAYSELAADPTKGQVRDALEDPPPARRWREADAAAVFVTGHGAKADGAHWTVLHATEHDRIPATALRTVDLISWLKHTRIQHLLLILDQCYAGQAKADAANFDSELLPTWLVLPSATKGQKAVTGALTGAISEFLAELHSPVGESYGGPRVPLLDVAQFLAGVQDKLGEGQRLIPLAGSQISGPHPCLPNPHFAPDDITAVAPPRSDLALPQRELDAHWDPRSRGVASTGQRGWLFTGRNRLMKDLIAAATGPVGTTLVTGGAGSGKSAVLARLVTFSDPAFRHRYRDRLDAVAQDECPPGNAVDVAVLATGKTPHEIIAQLCAALDVPTPATTGATPSLQEWVTTWHKWLTARQQPLTVVVDALDEAEDPTAVLTSVLARLDPRRDKVRLLVGVRSPGGDGVDAGPDRSLADHAQNTLGADRIRVDEQPWWDAQDLADYAANILATTPGSPYGAADASSAAHTLARRAGTSFLVTRIAAANLAARPDVVPPDDPGWLAAVDDGVLGVFRADLHTYRPDPEARLTAVHLLRAVAFSRGPGLPWRRIWPAVANAVADDSDRTYGDRDIADLLSSPLGGYLTTDIADDVTVYRLFHDTLRTTLREHWRDLLALPAP